MSSIKNGDDIKQHMGSKVKAGVPGKEITNYKEKKFMDEDNRKTKNHLQNLANIADQFTLLQVNRITTEVNIKLREDDYKSLISEVESITNVINPTETNTFSIDIDNVTFIVTKS